MRRTISFQQTLINFHVHLNSMLSTIRATAVLTAKGKDKNFLWFHSIQLLERVNNNINCEYVQYLRN